MILLETTRLLFRTHQAQDENEFVEMQTDTEVRRYVGGAPWPLEKARSRFRNEYLGKPTATYGLWATVLKEQNRYVGCCGLRRAEAEEAAFLAYYIARPFWGRGLASEASKAFIRVAFETLRLPRLLADVERGNKVSEHILEKFRFKFARQEELPGSGRFICYYELWKDDWKENGGSGTEGIVGA